jgi:hypothetical protein
MFGEPRLDKRMYDDEGTDDWYRRYGYRPENRHVCDSGKHGGEFCAVSDFWRIHRLYTGVMAYRRGVPRPTASFKRSSLPSDPARLSVETINSAVRID